jgi:hypothetical protein
MVTCGRPHPDYPWLYAYRSTASGNDVVPLRYDGRRLGRPGSWSTGSGRRCITAAAGWRSVPAATCSSRPGTPRTRRARRTRHPSTGRCCASPTGCHETARSGTRCGPGVTATWRVSRSTAPGCGPASWGTVARTSSTRSCAAATSAGPTSWAVTGGVATATRWPPGTPSPARPAVSRWSTATPGWAPCRASACTPSSCTAGGGGRSRRLAVGRPVEPRRQGHASPRRRPAAAGRVRLTASTQAF